MTEEQIALARRAVACRGWRWMPGMVMLWLSGEVGGFSSWARPMTVSSDGSINWWEGDPPTDEVDEVWQDKAIPDLTDAATLGCLLALVREAHHEPTYLPTCLDADDEAWVIESPAQERQTRYGSYASVLVAALEAA